MNNTILEVTNLKTYFFTNRGTVKAVDGISFELKRGECLCLVGESGCGKTVTALSLLRLIDSPPGRIIAGEVRYDSLNLVTCAPEKLGRIRGKEIAMISQDSQSALNPVFTIGDQITEQIRLHLKSDKKEAWKQAVSLMTEVGMPDAEKIVDYYPHQLSGGMKQRAMIAMSLSCEPKVLIADEPTTAVDVTIKAQIIDIFQRLIAKKQMSLIFITHDLGVVAEIGDRVIVMYAGKSCESGTVAEVMTHPSHPYTIGLMNCLPDILSTTTRLTSIPGTTPDPTNLPVGCLFQPRCPRAIPVCKEQEPLQIGISEGHSVNCHLYQKGIK